MVMVYEQGPGSSGVRIIMSWDLNREIFIFVILSPWDMIDYIIWGEQTITAILCLILIWCLKCMIFWNKHFQWWQVYQKVFHVLLLIWRVKFLAVFIFSSQWSHLNSAVLPSCCDFICFFILDFLHNICLQR